MPSFATAMNVSGSTWNGALSNTTPDVTGETSGRISLLFKAVRGLDKERLYSYLSEAADENIEDTIVLAFHIRDCRGGKGERAIGKQCFEWIYENHKDIYETIASLIPEYGRWDDILGNDVGNKIVASQLKKDIENMNSGKSVSLCAKWAPSEGSSLDIKSDLVSSLCRELGSIRPKEYRKVFISPLRDYIKIVEKYMSSNEWESIEYSKVPSQAIRRLKGAFKRNDKERFAEWSSLLASGETKANGKQASPHELVREIRKTGDADDVCEAQWKILEDEVLKLGPLNRALFVVDTSGSMCFPDNIPLDVSVSLGLLGASAVRGVFHNHVITFQSSPSFQVIKDGTLTERYKQISSIPWGSSTNIEAVFDLILDRGNACNLTDADMPEKVFIISDMQFDAASDSSMTNFKVIDKKYKESNFTRPNIIFWNVAGSSDDFPVTVDDNGTALISGFSPSVMKAVLTGGDYNPYTICREVIDDQRYDPVRKVYRQE